MVKISFTPPLNATPGGYYAAASIVGTTSTGASTRSIHATLLEVRGEGVLPAARIAGISVPSRTFGSTIPVRVHIENTGNVFAVASGRLVVRDMRSKITALVTIGKIPVVPGTPRILRIEVPAPAFPGRVRISAEIGFGEGVPRDTATRSILAFAWWHLVSGAIVLYVLIRVSVGAVRWRRRRKLLKPLKKQHEQARESVALPVGDADLQSEWERSQVTPSSTPVRSTPVAPPAVAGSPPSSPALVVEEENAGEEDREEDFWAPKSDVHTPLEIPPEEPAIEEPQRPTASPSKLAELMSLQRPADEPEPAPVEFVDPGPDEEEHEPEVVALEPEPEVVAVEPESQPEPETTPGEAVVVPLPRVGAEIEQETVEEPDERLARVHKLSEVVRAGVPSSRPSGPQAARRRIKAAVDMLSAGSGRSSERLDVAVQLLASAGGDVAGAVEESFESAAAAGRAGAMGSLALALALLDSPKAPEALLRAYAVAPRANVPALREAIKACDRDALRAQAELLDALPQDRRASLKLA